MQKSKEELTALIPQIQKAVMEISTQKELTDWVKPFIVELAAICMPTYLIEFHKKLNPQEEYKEEPNFRNTLTESITQFSDIVTMAEHDNDRKLQKYLTEKNELNKEDKLQSELAGNKFAQNIHYQNLNSDYNRFKETAIEKGIEEIQKLKQNILQVKKRVQTKIDIVLQEETASLFEQPLQEVENKIQVIKQPKLTQKSSIIRKSNHYKEPNPRKPQNLNWPNQPTYNNPIVAVLAYERYKRFNFLLLDGEKTVLPSDLILQENRFDPDSVKKAVLWQWEGDAGLCGIEIFDKNDKNLLRVGEMYDYCKRNIVELVEGERLVGISSFNSGNSAVHWNFQFIISKRA